MGGVAQIILVRTDGALLLQLRDNKPGISNPGMATPFGGGIEPGESPLEAACRELSEETNLRLSQRDLVPFGFYQKTVAKHGEDHDVYYFIARDIDDTSLEIYEGQGFVAVGSEQEAATINTSSLFREVLRDYYQRQPNSRHPLE